MPHVRADISEEPALSIFRVSCSPPYVTFHVTNKQPTNRILNERTRTIEQMQSKQQNASLFLIKPSCNQNLNTVSINLFYTSHNAVIRIVAIYFAFRRLVTCLGQPGDRVTFDTCFLANAVKSNQIQIRFIC
jgi:hypothetical protein